MAVYWDHLYLCVYKIFQRMLKHQIHNKSNSRIFVTVGFLNATCFALCLKKTHPKFLYIILAFN